MSSHVPGEAAPAQPLIDLSAERGAQREGSDATRSNMAAPMAHDASPGRWLTPGKQQQVLSTGAELLLQSFEQMLMRGKQKDIITGFQMQGLKHVAMQWVNEFMSFPASM